MKRTTKVLLAIIIFIVAGVLSTWIYLAFYLPRANPAPDIVIEATPARIARGQYIAHHVAVCMDCHSTRDWSRFARPLSGGLGAGGERFGKAMGFPGTLYAPNITPYKLADWTDGELFRAITTGVNKDGKALFPLMPYHHYGQMDREDIYSIIAYIRTLQPLDKEVPARALNFPVNLLVNTMPVEAAFSPKPDTANKILYGKYLVNMAACVDCHSQVDKGALIAGTEFGGGRDFQQPAGVVRSSNITPDNQTGIGSWSEQGFIQRFKQYADSGYKSPVMTPQLINTPMPWQMYAGMSESDLQAIYQYLRTVEPVRNVVQRHQLADNQ